MNDNTHPSSTDHDTVLAHINDPAPVESPEESDREGHDGNDDPSVLAHINDPTDTDDESTPRPK